MSIKDLVPNWRSRRGAPARREPRGGLMSLQHEMNRLFDTFYEGFGLAPFGGGADERLPGFAPRVNVSETDKDVTVSAELPGMDEKDVEVTLDDDVLTIRGEKKEEHEEKDGNWYHSERSYGSFQRAIAVPAGVDAEHVKARFKKGVLTVKMPKLAKQTESKKTIAIQTG